MRKASATGSVAGLMQIGLGRRRFGIGTRGDDFDRMPLAHCEARRHHGRLVGGFLGFIRADRFAVNDLIRQVYDARKDEKFDKTSNLQSLGLEPPHAVITLKQDGEREAVLNIGDVTPGERSSVVYVGTPGSHEPMAVRRSARQ